MCDCLKRRRRGGAGQLGLTEEGQQKLLFAGIWWQLDITALMQWNMNRTESMSQFNTTALLRHFNAAVVGKGRTSLYYLPQCNPEDCSVEEVQMGLTGTRSMSADQRTAGRFWSQERSLLALLISNTIYSSSCFSCKLHASTLTKDDELQANTGPLVLKDTTLSWVWGRYSFLHSQSRTRQALHIQINGYSSKWTISSLRRDPLCDLQTWLLRKTDKYCRANMK